MKKLLSGILSAVLLGTALFGAACASDDDLEVYAPDGAPALALAYAISEEERKDDENERQVFDFDIVDASTIARYVTGDRPEADICVLPSNAATKLRGDGEVYQMLGTITNGNLFFLTTGDRPALTSENLATALAGKKIGVVKLQDVPGLTLRVVLKQYGIEYKIAENVNEEVAEGCVNLIPFSPENVIPSGNCDYYLCPEPAASAKIKGTATTPMPFSDAGDLQALYGGTEGYPQAVVIAKKTVIRDRADDLKTFLSYLEGSEAFLKSAAVPTVLKLLADEREEGLAPSFSEANLTEAVIARCSVHYTPAKDGKEKLNSFLDQLIAVDANATVKPADAFFYQG